MRKMWDFRCSSCEHVWERLVRDDETPSCPECGSPSARVLHAPAVQLPGWDTAFPSAALKWEKQHEKAAKYVPGDDERIRHI